MRTLRIIARLNMGGPARHTTLLDARLQSRGYQTLLAYGQRAPGEGSLEHLTTELSVPAVHVPSLGRRISMWDDLRTLLTLLRVMRHVRPHIVHTHTAKAGAIGRIAATAYNLSRPRDERCAIVHTFHGHVLNGYFGSVGSAAVRWAERGLGLLTDRIVAISAQQGRDLVVRFRIAPARKVVVIPLGLDLDALYPLSPEDQASRAQLSLGQSDFVVAFVGRLVPIKDPVTLIHAFALMKREVPHARLLIAGDGPLRRAVEDALVAHDLRSSTTLVGWQEDLRPIYGAADVVALTSLNEGTPVAIIEAMAAARPVVATRVGGVPDVVVDGKSGYLVPSGDPAAIAVALTALAGDPDGRRRMGQVGREVVRSTYRPDRLVRDVDALYCALLKQRKAVSTNESAARPDRSSEGRAASR